MTAQVVDLEVDQGTLYETRFMIEVLTDVNQPESVSNPYIPFDLTGFEARLMVRESFDSYEAKLSLYSGQRITITPVQGLIEVKLFPADTSSLRFVDDKVVYVYDLEVYSSDSVVLRLVKGKFTLYREVTTPRNL